MCVRSTTRPTTWKKGGGKEEKRKVEKDEKEGKGGLKGIEGRKMKEGRKTGGREKGERRKE
jgi:hypothetical protein